MRLFSGSGGAVYLLGDHLADRERPRSLLATVGRWRLLVDETVAVGEDTLGGDTPLIGVRRGETKATLETVEFRSDLALTLGDELLVDLDAFGGHLVGAANLPPMLAVGQRQEPLVIDDLKEVMFHA